MLWLVLALIAHAGNAIVFIVDKALLQTKGAISSPVRFASYTSLMASLSFVLLAISYIRPTTFIVAWSLFGGIAWVAALWAFYASLKGGEASRVIPLVGTGVPVATFIIEFFVIGTPITVSHVYGAILLVIGGALLSLDFSHNQHHSGLSKKVIAMIVISATAFALHFVIVKFVYDSTEPFLAAFAYTRLGVALVAVVLLVGSAPFVRRTPKPKPRSRSKRFRIATLVTGTIGIFLISRVLSSAMFIVQNWSLDLSSNATIVNALQGTQYVFVLILVAILTKFKPHVLKEEVTRVSLAQKSIGIVLVSLGVAVLVL